MSDFLEDLLNSHGVEEHMLYIKLCPVCKAIFHIPGNTRILEAYCQECDTDYIFAKNEDLPISCKNRPTERRRVCNCSRCRDY